MEFISDEGTMLGDKRIILYKNDIIIDEKRYDGKSVRVNLHEISQ